MLKYNFRQRDRAREKRARKEGSPLFTHSFGSLSASGGAEFVRIEDTFPAAVKYQPMDSLQITNQSGQALDAEVNGGSVGLIPQNYVWVLEGRAIWSLRLTNNQAVDVASGDVTAIFQRKPLTADELARQRGA